MQWYDRWLTQKAIRGDRAAFGKIYDRHAARVFRLLRRLTGGDIPAAEDLTQETFLTAWTSLADWRGRGALSTFLCGIAVNRYRNQRRTERRRPTDHSELDEAIPTDESDTNPLLALTRKEAHAALERAIAALPDVCREVFVLVRVEGMAYKEAAELLGVPLGTAQSRLARATKLLRIALTDAALPDSAPLGNCERNEPCPATSKTP